MILEGIVTSESHTGQVNVAPMGPIVDPAMNHLVLRPYQSSTTYANLKQSGCGVLHVTDDVEMFAQAAVRKLQPLPQMLPRQPKEPAILAGACRWYAFEVTQLDDSQERTHIECQVVDRGRLRDFFGFNRAKHAVIEAAILATRVEFLAPEIIQSEMQRLAVPVEKTAGEVEQRAFAFLVDYVAEALAAGANPAAS